MVVEVIRTPARRFEMSDKKGTNNKGWFVCPGYTMFTMQNDTVSLCVQPAVGVLTISDCSPIDSDEPPEGYQELKEEDTHLILRSITNAIEKSLAGEEFELEIEPWPTAAVEEKMLTKELAEELLRDAEAEGYVEMYLMHFTTIEAAAASVLSKFQGELEFNDLTSLPDAAAKSLSKHKGRISLMVLSELSDAAAENLSKHEGEYLSLSGLTELSDAAAENLSTHAGELFLDGLAELSAAAAESLSKHDNTLSLEVLTELSDVAAESLSKHKGRLYLEGLTELSDAAAESLSKHEGEYLSLSGLAELSDAAAKHLANHADVSVEIDNLPASAAKILRDAGHGV